ncbi:hypothetical protein QE152_g28327 [Popillia japonica]|uniref:Uncharacterized protein n=1 Tax=Popillia japonica TaxID=7064 RepID=A0AAW1JKS6_POPJA
MFRPHSIICELKTGVYEPLAKDQFSEYEKIHALNYLHTKPPKPLRTFRSPGLLRYYSSLYGDEVKMIGLPRLLSAVFCFLVACGIFFGDTLKLELGCGDDDDDGVAANDYVDIVWLGMVTFGISESDLVGLPIVTEVF